MNEKWTKGKHAGCVVSGTPNNHKVADDHVDYYGGYLVAESISKTEHVSLIAAAPDLLDALWAILGWDIENVIPGELFKQAKAAIDKAKGGL